MNKLSLLGSLMYLIAAMALAMPVSALDLADNKFVFTGYVNADEKSGSYSIKEGLTDREFLLSSAQLKNNKVLRASLERVANADGPNQSVRFSGIWARKGQEIDPASLQVEIINGEKDCPEKIYSTHTTTGIYLGTEWGDFGHVMIKAANGSEIHLYGDGEEVFGKKTGIRVSANVQTAQEWLDTGDWGMCVISDFLVSGKKLK